MGGVGKGHHVVRDAQGVPVGQDEGHHPDDQAQGAALPQGVDPEAAQAGDGEGEVVVPHLQKAVHGPPGQLVELLGQGLGVVGEESLPHPVDAAADLVGHGQTGDDEDVGGLPGDGLVENVDERHGARSSFF